MSYSDYLARIQLLGHQLSAAIKRAEAAEVALCKQREEVDKANALIDDLREERDLLQRLSATRAVGLEAAEAKLAEVNDLEVIRSCLSFFTSAIKCKEGWSVFCQRSLDAALNKLAKIEKVNK